MTPTATLPKPKRATTKPRPAPARNGKPSPEPYDVREARDAYLAHTKQTDPHVMASEFYKTIPASQHAQVLLMLLPDFMRFGVRERRGSIPASALPNNARTPGAPMTGGRIKHGQANGRAARLAESAKDGRLDNMYNQLYHVPASGEWKRFGDLTSRDCRSIGDHREKLENANRTEKVRFWGLADALDERKKDTVRDLPPGLLDA